MSKTVLVVAAHPDDEVLGVGGTIARHAAAGDAVHILILAEGEASRAAARDNPQTESRIAALRDAARQAAAVLGAKPPRFAGFPDNRMDGLDLLDVVKYVEAVIAELRPNTIYTHHAGDLNIDHEVAHRAVVTAARPLPDAGVEELYTFEVLSSTEWQSADHPQPFIPRHFVGVDRHLDLKIKALRCYDSEMRPFPHPRSYDAVTHLARLRGAQCGLAAAEAFGVVRQVRR